VYYKFFNAAKLQIIIVLLFALSVQSFAQRKSAIDSLQQIVADANNEHDLLNAKLELTLEYTEIDFQKAFELADECYDLALQLGDTAQIVTSGRLKGQLLRRLDNLKDAIKILLEVEPIAKRNNLDDDYRKILNALAVAYMFKADYDKALQYNFKSLVLREADGNKAEMSIALNNIGLIYSSLKNFETAIKYFNRSIELKNEVNDTYELDGSYLNRGLCFIQLRKYKEASEDLEKGLSICGTNCDEQSRLLGEYGLGESAFGLGEMDEAELHFKKSLKIATASGSKRHQAENFIYLGAIAINDKNYDSAIVYLKKAESLAASSDYNQLLVDGYKQFSRLYNQLNDYQNEAIYQNKYIRLTDSLFREDLVKNIAKVETEYAERENMATIASNEIVIKQSRELSIAIAVIALLAGLLVLVLQFGNRNIKRVNAKLSEAKEVIQEKNQELANKNRELDFQVEKKTADLAKANSSLKQVNDELDNFIYKTSHDIRGPLASLKGMCNVALMDVTDPTALDYLRKLDATAERLNTILTRLVIINQINNSKLTIEHIDFESIVSDVLLLERKKGVPQELLIIPQIDKDATIESDKELVRIVLENLIDNAIKFYNDSDRVKSFVKIHINSMPKGGVIVRVIDNGIGISESSPGKLFQMFSRASERSETGGIGLYITKTATEKIGGKVGLLTTPEGYTEFYVIFPPSPFNESERMLRASSF
jgi:signal transduction histidine kinase